MNTRTITHDDCENYQREHNTVIAVPIIMRGVLSSDPKSALYYYTLCSDSRELWKATKVSNSERWTAVPYSPVMPAARKHAEMAKEFSSTWKNI